MSAQAARSLQPAGVRRRSRTSCATRSSSTTSAAASGSTRPPAWSRSTPTRCSRPAGAGCCCGCWPKQGAGPDRRAPGARPRRRLRLARALLRPSRRRGRGGRSQRRAPARRARDRRAPRTRRERRVRARAVAAAGRRERRSGRRQQLACATSSSATRTRLALARDPPRPAPRRLARSSATPIACTRATRSPDCRCSACSRPPLADARRRRARTPPLAGAPAHHRAGPSAQLRRAGFSQVRWRGRARAPRRGPARRLPPRARPPPRVARRSSDGGAQPRSMRIEIGAGTQAHARLRARRRGGTRGRRRGRRRSHARELRGRRGARRSTRTGSSSTSPATRWRRCSSSGSGCWHPGAAFASSPTTTRPTTAASPRARSAGRSGPT